MRKRYKSCKNTKKDNVFKKINENETINEKKSQLSVILMMRRLVWPIRNGITVCIRTLIKISRLYF